MGWLIALAVLATLAILPIGVSAIYDAGGAAVWVIVGPIRFKAYPKRKKKDGKKEEKEADKKAKKKTASSEEKKKGGSFTDFFPLVQVALDLVKEFFRKLRVKRLELKIILAGDDPSDLAINYGKAWAAMGNLIPLLDQCLVIKKRDMEVECDFTADTTTVYARADLTIMFYRLQFLVFRYGYRGLREYIKIYNLRKGGALK